MKSYHRFDRWHRFLHDFPAIETGPPKPQGEYRTSSQYGAWLGQKMAVLEQSETASNTDVLGAPKNA